MPSTACLVQDRLGLPVSCAAMDFTLGCSGFVYGLGLVKGLDREWSGSNLLLVNADTYSKLVHPADKSVRTLFGDAATVALSGPVMKKRLIGPFVYGTDGKGVKDIVIPAGAKRQPTVHNPELIRDDSGNARTVNNLYMNGAEVFNFTLRTVPAAVQKSARQSRTGEVRYRPCSFSIRQTASCWTIFAESWTSRWKSSSLAMEQTGNTVSCSIPLALQHASKSGQLRPGALVMLVAFGVGYSWAATLIRWGDTST